MELFSSHQRRGMVVMLSLLLIVLAIFLLAEHMLAPEFLTEEAAQVQTAAPLQSFDPNADDYLTMRQKGVPTDVAVGIVRWRSYGKVYRIKEDLAQVTGMTDSLYEQLEPYISIADSVAARPVDESVVTASKSPVSKEQSHREVTTPDEPFLIDTASVAYLTRWGLTERQAEVVVRYRDASGGIFDEEHLRRCYVISDKVAEHLLRYIIFSEKPAPQTAVASKQESAVPGRVEINTADSAMLVAVDGIGPKSASEIIKYRRLLGGYHSVEQLSELKCITESNFEKILPKIWCDSFVISKIDINFARSLELERHPYISAQALRRIVKQRQLKGGWTRIEEMIDDDILSEEEAKRLAPYLRFRLSATE
jgi:competence ComEA-like helix-hairpin-helix protein